MKIPISKQIRLNLFRHYRRIEAKRHQLNYLFWECTLRCNLNCAHCGSDCISQSNVPDMPGEDFLNAVDSISPVVNPNKTAIVITGGEPLLRRDLEEVGAELNRRGFPWGIVTNGLLLSSGRFRSLIDAGMHSMTVSLDGLRESHNWMRQRKGSFEKAVQAISYAASTENFTFDVVTCVNQKNFRELTGVKELLISLGVKKWRLFTVFPKGRAKEKSDLKLNSKQFKELMRFIEATRAEGKISASYSCEGFLGTHEFDVRNNPFYCRAGITIGSILVDGSISACPSLRGDYVQGNIYEDDFCDVWENRYEIMRDRSWTKKGKCADCSVYNFCEGNGLHLRDESTGELLMCHYEMLR